MRGPNHFHNERNMCFFSFFSYIFRVFFSPTEIGHFISFFCLRHLAKGGVKAVFVNGTTGEGVQVRQFKTAPRSSSESSISNFLLYISNSPCHWVRERSCWRRGCIKKITAPPSWHRCILSQSHCTWFFALDFCTCYNLWRETKICISQSWVSQCLPFYRDFAGLRLQFQRHLGADKARRVAWSCCHR